jgi:hydrogenase maturation protein HypF
LEEQWLQSSAAPIVLLRRREYPISISNFQIAENVAPGNPNLGVMLPSNPLHQLLMAELNFPVVATSGNLSDEPICTDEYEALERLRGIADITLVHNRPIVRPVDDSIIRVMLGREMILRRARGFAPLPISLKSKVQNPKSKVVLAVGAHLKNSVALAVGENVFISQHLGDLETEESNRAFRRSAEDLPRFYDAKPEIIAADLHPDYLSTKFAQESGGKIFGVQHHVAHVLSCIAENEVELPALGVAWDGAGFGTDGSIWGGEFFQVGGESVQRIAHLRPFQLPGGGKAIQEPRRVALGLLYELYGEAAFEMHHLAPLRETPPVEMITLRGMLQRRFNSPSTSSIGRLFDAVASLANLRQRLQFEGQAAMELEFAIDGFASDQAYKFPLVTRGSLPTLNWSPLIEEVLRDAAANVPIREISVKFHNALAEAVVAVAKFADEPRVALSGGCFQNRYLTERTVRRLREENFQPFWHRQLPTNDGGIALGQIYAARNNLTLK